LFRYIHQLEELEYIEKRGHGSHGATQYKILFWDDNVGLKARIQADLHAQLDQL